MIRLRRAGGVGDGAHSSEHDPGRLELVMRQ